MRTLILNTAICRIYQSKSGYEMEITCNDGSIVEHQPFPPDQQGLVSAISLSAEILAGKFWIKSVIKTPVNDESRLLGQQKKGLK